MSTWGRRGLSRAVGAAFSNATGALPAQYPGCTIVATEIDDIIPVSLLGNVYAARNSPTTTGKPSAARATTSRPRQYQAGPHQRGQPHTDAHGCAYRSDHTPARCDERRRSPPQTGPWVGMHPKSPGQPPLPA